MELTKIKSYLRVDYDDDDVVIKTMYEAVLEEMKELIPTFDEENITKRQELLICAYVKELYDNRGNTTAGTEKIRYAVRSLLLKEMLR